MEFLGDVVAWFTDGENWQGDFGLPNRIFEHVRISAVSILIACALALPVGLTLGHLRRGGALAVNVSNIGRAIPSFALLVLALQLFGFGSTPTYVALVALAVPPILTNTYVAIGQVDPELREAAAGMGMRGTEVLRRIELPLAVPLVMAGVRTSAVQVVATATLAAFIGEGGLGRFIVDGRAVRDNVTVFAGAFVVALLSIVTEVLLGGVQRLLTPRGLAVSAPEEVSDAFADAVAVH